MRRFNRKKPPPQEREEENSSEPDEGGERPYPSSAQESIEFIRGRDSDRVVVDEPGEDGIPIENLYSSAGEGDLHREGDAPEALTDLPDIPTTPAHTTDEELTRLAEEAIVDEFGEGLNIEVIVEHRELTLTGSVDSREVAQDIVETLETLPGLERVLNELDIAEH